MGRKEKSSKAAEKKARRLEMEKKMNERVAIVKAANAVSNPLEQLPSFAKFNKNDLELTMETTRTANLKESDREWLMDLLRDNMKTLYEESHWGWKEKNKREEVRRKTTKFCNLRFLAQC